jgi:hypothetical protein
MNSTNTSATIATVPPDEVERRVAEYRRLAFEHEAMPRSVYQEPFIICPWPGCGFRVVAVDFQIEKHGNPALNNRAVFAWWQGPGIVGRCPGCGQFVLFSIGQKQQVPDPPPAHFVVLPDDWHQQAYIVSRTQTARVAGAEESSEQSGRTLTFIPANS